MLPTNDRPGGWVIVSSLQFLDALMALRLAEHVEIALTDRDVWIRSRNNDPKLLSLVESMPASQRFSWTADNLLCPTGSRLPTGRFPEVDWHPFSRWLNVALPTAVLPTGVETKCNLTLVASERGKEANALLASSDIWFEWASIAPALRLRPLKFAASFGGRVLILGQPLPPVPGTRLVDDQGIVVPAGFTWRPAVSPSTLRELLGVGQQIHVLWDEHGVQLLADELFVTASRASARATREAIHGLRHE